MFKMRFHDWKGVNQEVVSRRLMWMQLEATVARIMIISTLGGTVQGSITHREKDTEEDSIFIETLQGDQILNQGKPSVGSNRQKLMLLQ